MCCFVDSVWSRCTPRYVTVVLKGMLLPPISADSQPTELMRSDGSSLLFSVLSFSLLLCIHEKVRLYRIECWTEKK